MKLLVTGGAGFIGSNFIRYMINNYPFYHIYNLDLLTYSGNLKNLMDLEINPRYTFIKGSISDQSFVFKLFEREQFDYVINFAAESHVDRSIVNPNLFIQTNVVGTQILLEASKKNNVKKFIQISTDEVYGALGEKGYFTESSPLAPNSPYSASKASADFFVHAYYETYNLPINITRCSNNYGPSQFPEKLIPLVITRAFNNQSIPLYGNGLNIRDWLYVEDHCTAIDLVLHNGQIGEVYNIGGNNEYTNIDLVRMILNYLNKPETLIENVEDRPGHDFRYAIDSTKISNELGWSPIMTFKSGIEKTINWYIDHLSITN